MDPVESVGSNATPQGKLMITFIFTNEGFYHSDILIQHHQEIYEGFRKFQESTKLR